MKRFLCTIGCACLALSLAGAPADAKVKKGDKEVSFFGALIDTSPDEGESTTTLIVQVAGGVFVSDNTQVGGSVTQTSLYNSFTVTLRLINGFVKYHFNPNEPVVTYVGAQAGMAFIEFDSTSDSGLSYGAMAGAKYFVSANLSLNGEASLSQSKIADTSATQTMLQVGMSYYF